MNYKLILLITVLSVLRCHVIGIPITSGIVKDSPNDLDGDSETVEVVSNEIAENPDPSELIDLSVYGQSLYGEPDFNKTGQLVAEFNPNKTSVNPEELGSYLEGDILMPKSSLILKNGLEPQYFRWPNGEVPLEIAGGFNNDELDRIAFAINEYHAKTCIRFIPHTWQSDYVVIDRQNSGCWSSMGRVGGKQTVNLQTPACLIKHGVAIHELMHALGFYHEQNRKERDAYVHVLMENVIPNARFNFNRIPNTIDFGIGYDYNSIMHYSSKAFSANGLPTLVAKKPEGRYMGQRENLSRMDIAKVNRMYRCYANPKPKVPPVKLSKRV